MIYFGVKDILASALCFLLFGIACGIIYPSADVIIDFLSSFFLAFYRAYRRFLKKHAKKSKQTIKKQTSIKQMQDFFLILIAGAFYILTVYITLDGAFRVFTLFFFVIGYLMSKKFLGNPVSVFYRIVFAFVIRTVDFFTYILLYPVYLFLSAILKLIKPVIRALRNKYRKFRVNRIVVKKCREISKVLNSGI